MNAYLNGTSTFFPGEPVTNDEIEQVLGMPQGRPSVARARVLRVNGIKRRFYALDRATGRPTHTNAQLAAQAVRTLVQESGLDLGRDVPLLACGTASPDQLLPSHAAMVHGELGSPPCEIVSTAGACVASTSALKYAALAVAAGDARRAVVSGSELISPMMRGAHFEPELEERLKALEEKPQVAFEHDFLRWMLSDGAGAALVEPEPVVRNGRPSLKIEWIDLLSHAGQMEPCMYHLARKRGAQLESWKTLADPHDRVKEGHFNMGQDSRLLVDHISRLAGPATLGVVMKKRNLGPRDVQWLLPHYSSDYFRGTVLKGLREVGLELNDDNIVSTLATHGNIGTASLFAMLDALLRSGRAQSGQRILAFIPESARFLMAYALFTVV